MSELKCEQITNQIDRIRELKSRADSLEGSGQFEEAKKIQGEARELLDSLKEEVFNFIYKDWETYKDGEVIMTDNDKVSWESHAKGILYQKYSGLWINGQQVSSPNSHSFSWSSHPRGRMYLKNDEYGDQPLVFIPVSGKGKYVYRFKENDSGSWQAHPYGFIIQKDKDILLNGKRKICELPNPGSEYAWHPDGVTICERDEKNNRMILKLNNEKTIYSGPIARWRQHPKGFLIERHRNIYLNNKKLIYENDGEEIIDFSWHPNGVIIRRKQNAGNKYYWAFRNEEKSEP